ncbi:MAG: division/cell wall cluster transcriptional repressor MraZ [Bacteroidetes bacterium]|nr:MAG: division/cell wall cluster transcriptional repressor MraZ [Bacteroidota bacterium]
MSNIIGTYECKVDVKGRLMFPVAFKGQLDEDLSKGFAIKRSIFRKCLELYPMEEWTLESKRINNLNRFVKKNVDFIRKFMAGVKNVELDSTGRLLIPKDLITYAGIKKEIVLASVVNKIEIWDKSEYEEAVDYDPDEFADLAEEVMGNKETEPKD